MNITLPGGHAANDSVAGAVNHAFGWKAFLRPVSDARKLTGKLGAEPLDFIADSYAGLQGIARRTAGIVHEASGGRPVDVIQRCLVQMGQRTVERQYTGAGRDRAVLLWQ